MSTPVALPPNPPVETLPAGAEFYRVHLAKYPADAFNPGPTPAEPLARFSFFGSPTVPALYAADSVDAAIGETLLRTVPDTGGAVPLERVEQRMLSRVVTTREVRLLRLSGFSYRELRVDRGEVSAAGGIDYEKTVLWGQAAHDAGLDGIVWMSRHHDSSRAYVLYQPGTVQARPGSLIQDFTHPDGLDWLTRQLARLNVDIRFA